MCYFTVCTPTFNRAYILRRPYESLKKQTFKDFEWLIIDDGSTDNTEELVRGFIEQADFPVRYVRKENGGRASALNESYKHIMSKYVINLDSDDELTEEALQKLHDAWESIPAEEYERFWCITGHCINSETGAQIGPMWPQGINKLKGKEQHRALIKNKGGEKSCCRKIDVLRQFPFPQYEETKFVPEDIVWEEINLHYDQYCLNEVLRVYYTNSTDALSKSSHKLSTKVSYYFLALSYINNCFGQICYNKQVARSILDICRLAILTKKKYYKVMAEINRLYKRAVVSLVWPGMWILTKAYYHGKKFL